MDTICDRCGRPVDLEDARWLGHGEWQGATLCPDCAAAVETQETEDKPDPQER